MRGRAVLLGAGRRALSTTTPAGSALRAAASSPVRSFWTLLLSQAEAALSNHSPCRFHHVASC